MEHVPSSITLPRVAVIEDDECMAMLLLYNLTATGIVVEWIADGRDALAQLRVSPPDAVILDWELPSLSGIEILRQLRASVATRHVPVLMLTGRADPADRERALTLGVDVFLAKPFSLREVVTRLLELLERGRPVIRSTPTATAGVS